MSIEQVIRACETALNENDPDTILGLYGAEGNNELFVFGREGDAWRIHRSLSATNLAHG